MAAGHAIVVGIDPERDWETALAWAADAAHRRNTPLRLVTALPVRRGRHRAGAEPTPRPAVRSHAQQRLDESAEWAARRHPDTDVTADLTEGVPSAVLCRMSAQAHMIVLGSRNLGRGEAVLSSSSLVLPVTSGAECPVAVVGEPEPPAQEDPFLVVGVDGGPAGEEAVRWAFEEAAMRRCGIRAIAAHPRSVLRPGRRNTAEEDTRRMLDEALAGWTDRYPQVTVGREVVSGRPASALTAAGEEALAVVVGRRSPGGPTGVRLGSVGRGLLRAATCPVVTVPKAGAEEDG